MLCWLDTPHFKFINCSWRNFPCLPCLYYKEYLKAVLIQWSRLSYCLQRGRISEVVILMIDEMYLQKSEEYHGGEIVGCDEEGKLYIGLV